MSVIYFLIGVGIFVAGGFLAAFIWAVKSGQYDDDYTPSVRMLFDDYKPDANANTSTADTTLVKKTDDVEKSNNN